MLTSKQRAYLRSLANSLDTILMVGKSGMSPELVKQADDALTARELIKGRALETAPLSPRDAAEELARETGVPYLVSDFKKRNGYKRSVELSAEYGLYRQNYCGCVYSRAEAAANGRL